MINDAYLVKIEQAATIIRTMVKEPIEWLLVLGSGLGALADAISDAVTISYEEIPGFPKSTVPGHAGKFVFGKWAGHSIAIMQGRFHYYEGHSMEDVVLPIRVMQELGVENILLTNAAGGIGEDMRPGDLMLITDHIGLFAESPLRGANIDKYGSRFIDQSQIYDLEYSDLLFEIAGKMNIKMHKGVYAWCRGPQFETPAEIRLLKMVGAGAAGMSTVPEAITASHGGMRIVALSCITNFAAGLSEVPLSHEEVMETGSRVAESTIKLITSFLETI
jgi:purine-nucleoside phosphorylase